MCYKIILINFYLCKW